MLYISATIIRDIQITIAIRYNFVDPVKIYFRIIVPDYPVNPYGCFLGLGLG